MCVFQRLPRARARECNQFLIHRSLGYSPQTASRQTPPLLRIVKLRDRLAPLMGMLQGRRLARKRDLLRQLTDHMQWALTDLMEFTGLTAAGSGRRVSWRPHTGPQGLALSAAGG